jgi:predicted permease
VENFIQDVRFAFRTFRGNPGFTLLAVLTLALGIGANTAIFTVVDAVLLRSLPVAQPRQLVVLTNPDAHGMSNGAESGDRGLLAYSEFEYLRDHQEVFSGIFASDSTLAQLNVTISDSSGGSGAGSSFKTGATQDAVRIRMVSGDYFSTLGVRPIIGRAFGPEVDRARDSNPVAVISHAFWRQRFSADPQVLGRKIQMHQTAFEIIGVAPAGFFGETVGEAPDVWVPLTMQQAIYPGDDLLTAFPTGTIDQRIWLQVMARLKPGVTAAQASANLNVVFPGYVSEAAKRNKLSGDEAKEFSDQKIKVQAGGRGASTLNNGFGEPLKLLMALVALVLLIACANLANLLLARGAARKREFAVRLSIGAGRGRLIRQLLTESFLLAILGAGLGVVLAQWADSLLLRMVSPGGSSLGQEAIQLSLRPDVRVLAFTFAVAILTALLFGLIPALRATRLDLSPMLKSGTSGATVEGHGRRFPAGKILVVVQVSVSLVLLVAAGLFAHSLAKLSEVQLGYKTERLLLFRVRPVAAGYKDAAIPRVFQELLDKFKAVPGVSAASLSVNGLFSHSESGDPISVEGYTAQPGELIHSRMDEVGPDYFSVMGMPILSGRGITAQDSGNGPRVAVINQTFAKQFFPNTDPIGKRVTDTYPGNPAAAEIVGVVADAKYNNVREEAQPRLYTPLFNPLWPEQSVIFEIRTAADPAAVSAALRAVVHDTNSAIPEIEIHTMSGLVDDSLQTDHFVARLSAAFGMLAIVLASVGLYGIMAFTVARRTRDIGIRMALGAGRSMIVRQVLRETLILMLVGIAVGVPVALAGTRLIKSMLFGLGATDPWAIGAACAILAVIAALAGYIPARRASQVDPMVALRYE